MIQVFDGNGVNPGDTEPQPSFPQPRVAYSVSDVGGAYRRWLVTDDELARESQARFERLGFPDPTDAMVDLMQRVQNARTAGIANLVQNIPVSVESKVFMGRSVVVAIHNNENP